MEMKLYDTIAKDEFGNPQEAIYGGKYRVIGKFNDSGYPVDVEIRDSNKLVFSGHIKEGDISHILRKYEETGEYVESEY